MSYRKRNSADKNRLKARLFRGLAAAPCCFCRRRLVPSTATLEHVLPLSAGGGWGKENLRLSCGPCNRDRGVEDFSAYRRRVQGRLASPRARKED